MIDSPLLRDARYGSLKLNKPRRTTATASTNIYYIICFSVLTLLLIGVITSLRSTSVYSTQQLLANDLQWAGACKDYCSQTGCDWTNTWVCPWEQAFGLHTAWDDNSLGFNCCCEFRQTPTQPCGGYSMEHETVKGVNLGGWFVLEPWITPSPFDETNSVDEWTLHQHPEAKAILETHYDTFFTEKDLQKLRDFGVTHVRIPIGYWMFPEHVDTATEPYKDTNSLFYFKRALTWCANVGLKVLVDLHGAPGSQNGFDNSGHLGPMLWGTSNTLQRTLDILTTICNTVKNEVMKICFKLCGEEFTI